MWFPMRYAAERMTCCLPLLTAALPQLELNAPSLSESLLLVCGICFDSDEEESHS